MMLNEQSNNNLNNQGKLSNLLKEKIKNDKIEIDLLDRVLESKDNKLVRNKSEEFDDNETNYITVEGDNKTVSEGYDLGELSLECNQITTGKLTTLKYTYIGEICNKKRHGFGYCIFKNSDYLSYTGQWKDDKMDGFGKLKRVNENYEGEFKNNEPNGYIEQETPKAITRGVMKGYKFIEGVLIIKKKDKYVIEADIKYIGENIMGFGVINDFSGNLYEGELQNFGPYGWGIHQKKDKYIYKGQQDKGFNGYGEVYCADGSKYFGFFKNNKKHGVVINFNVKEERISFAKYSDDSKNGATLNVHKNGLKVEIWHNGYRVKLIENFDLAKKYINSCYPEHEWIFNLDYMNMINYFGKLNCK